MSKASLEFHDLNLGMHENVITAYGQIEHRTGQEIHLTLDGQIGKGEVMPLPGWSKNTAEQTKKELESIQRDPDQFFLSPLGYSPEVQAGMTSAYWSQRASAAREPLWSILGGSADEIMVNALIGGGTKGRFRRSILTALEQGNTTLKIKMGFPDDEDRLQIIVDEIAPDTRIRLDSNASWSLQQAIDFIDLADGLLGDRLEYVEDPVKDIKELQQIRTNLSVAIATDSLTPTIETITHAIEESLTDYVVLKPSLLGGIEPVLKIAKLAEDKGISVIVSSTYDGPVGLHSWCHLAAAIGNGVAHGLGTASLINDKRMESLIPTRGCIKLV
jgi:o-succinylbenzoate synthase